MEVFHLLLVGYADAATKKAKRMDGWMDDAHLSDYTQPCYSYLEIYLLVFVVSIHCSTSRSHSDARKREQICINSSSRYHHQTISVRALASINRSYPTDRWWRSGVITAACDNRTPWTPAATSERLLLLGVKQPRAPNNGALDFFVFQTDAMSYHVSTMMESENRKKKMSPPCITTKYLLFFYIKPPELCQGNLATVCSLWYCMSPSYYDDRALCLVCLCVKPTLSALLYLSRSQLNTLNKVPNIRYPILYSCRISNL